MSDTEYYVGEHWCQLAPGMSPVTRSEGCTWTSGASGVAAISGGSFEPTPDHVHDQVPRSQETNPDTPGWSIPDLAKAMGKLGVTFLNRTNAGWDGLMADLLSGHYVVLQGVSREFADNTCSGAFNGPHAIGISPNARQDAQGNGYHLIDDPICKAARWERDSVLRRYAEALASNIRFGTFQTPVPRIGQVPVNPPSGGGKHDVAIRYMQPVDTGRRMKLAKGQRLYVAPGGKAVTSMSKAAAVPYLGLASPAAGMGWRMVQVGTGTVYKDKKQRPTGLYVPADAGKVVEA